MGGEPAGRAEPGTKSEPSTDLVDPREWWRKPEEEAEKPIPTEDPLEVRADRLEVREAAARLYGQGYKRPQIARILRKHLITNMMLGRPMDQQLSTARAKLRRWERDQKFRDLIYNDAVIKLDLDMPGIFKGIAKKARRGRVDAARLALEVTGRHNPKGDSTPPQIALIINGVPRPRFHQDINHPQVEVDGNGTLIQGEEEA